MFITMVTINTKMIKNTVMTFSSKEILIQLMEIDTTNLKQKCKI